MQQEVKARISRRAFLTRAGLTAGAAGAAAVAVGGASPAEAAQQTRGRRVAGYRETEHVRRAYALSRF